MCLMCDDDFCYIILRHLGIWLLHVVVDAVLIPRWLCDLCCFYGLNLYMLTVFTYAHYLYICSLSLHMLIIFTYAHCLYIYHVANDVTFDFILITIELMLCCQWCCFVFNFCQFWAYALVSMKFRMLHNMSTCIVFVFSALFGLWWNCPTLEII
jgi:hypothetical protein